MLRATKEDADLVVASRYFDKGSASGLAGATRHLVSAGARTVARILFTEARRSTDPLSGFFLCRRELIDGIEFRPVGFKILLELLVCVPKLRVRDVPMTFATRASGESKATMAQGWTFLRHVWSLFTQVSGSARPWKFATVGVAGLVLFVGLLQICNDALHFNQTLTFLAAFLPTLVFNTIANRLWTFADFRGRMLQQDTRGYLLSAIAAGVLAFAVYTLLRRAGMNLWATGLLTSGFAMAWNGAVNLRRVARRPFLWARVSTDTDVVSRLARLARAVGADRAYVLPPDGTASLANIPREVVERAGRMRRASLWTEASFHRAQRRTNIDLHSTLIVPVVNGGLTVGFVICERRSPTAYRSDALERATRAVEEMAPYLASAAGERAARLGDRLRTGEKRA
jgi:dolichol-phosphate mannosyltransferase